MEIVSILSAVSGLISGGWGNYMAHKGEKLKKDIMIREIDARKDTEAHNERMYELETQRVGNQNEYNKDIARTEAEQKTETAIQNTRIAGFKEMSTQTGTYWLDLIRSLNRPVITWYLLFLVSWLSYRIFTLGNLEMLPQEVIRTLMYMTIYFVFVQAANACGFWFGSRSVKVDLSQFTFGTNR